MDDLDPDHLRTALAGRYTIGRELGAGGMAVVFSARDLKHGRDVALKVIRPDLAPRGGAARFLREIALCARLHHPNILPLLDSGDAGGLPYYVMPLVTGGSLRERLVREGSLPIESVLAIVSEVADALDHAHAQGVIHRDIKPENILFEGGHALVADFGIARALSEAGAPRLTETGVAMGTPAYMSPEQAGGSRGVDARSDIYALACVAYEMLGGEPPFTGPSVQAVLARHMQERVPSLRVVRPAVSAGLQDALERGLAKVPADRYPTAGALAAALRAARGSPRRRSRAALTAGVAAVAVLGALWLVADGSPGWRGAGDAAAGADPKRIAVLYFDDLSRDSSLAHVAGGLTEDLIDELSQVPSLRVISPNGVRPFRAGAAGVDSIARALGVGTVVGGSVLRSGDSLRVTVRLIEAVSGEQMQSRTVGEAWADLPVLQDKLTAEAAEFLRQRLGEGIRLREARARTRSARAWELLQQGQLLAQRGAAAIRAGTPGALEDLVVADSLLGAAARADPDWPQPVVARGWNAWALAFASSGPASARQERAARSPLSRAWVERAIADAEEALRREPGSPEARVLRGDMRFRLRTILGATGDSLLPGAESDLRSAIARRPDLARPWASLGELEFMSGRYVEAARDLQRAFEADAFLTDVRAVVSLRIFAALHAEWFGEAAAWCRLGRERFPGDPRFAECELTLLGWDGRGRRDAAAAWRHLEAIERGDTLGMLGATWGWRRMMVAAVLARSGMADSARAVLAAASAPPAGRGGTDARVTEAGVYVLLGDHDAAVRVLGAYLRDHPDMRAYVATMPWLRPLRDDPRFRALVAVAGA